MAPNQSRVFRLGPEAMSAGRRYSDIGAERQGPSNRNRIPLYGSSSGAISPSISELTSSSSSSSSSRKVSSAASSSSTSMSSTTGSAAFSSAASTSSSETISTAAAAGSSSASSSLAIADSARIVAPWNTVPHFGQTIGSRFMSKNFAAQAWHWRL